MGKRQYREARLAKRASPDDIALARSFGGPVDYSQAEYLAADHQYNRDKTDPAAFDRLIHDMHADEVRVVRAIGGGL